MSLAAAVYETRILLREEPLVGSRIVSLTLPYEPVKVLELRGDWTLIQQGPVVGWALASSVSRALNPGDLEMIETREVAPDLESEASFNRKESEFTEFIDFVAGNPEKSQKMSDPFYKHRIQEVSDRWGPLFYQKTPFFYRKGIHLAQFYKGQVKFSLVKQRIYYGALMGGLWSDRFVDAVLESNEGLLRSRALFGKGREYFLECSFHFD